LITTKPAIR